MTRHLPHPDADRSVQHLSQWPLDARARLRGLMTDIDDTLTRDGEIEPAALDALHALAAAGLPVVAVTGRPAGWSENFALAWPVAAIVAENGAVALINRGGHLERAFVQDAPTRLRHAQRLADVLARIERELPPARRARDSAGRLTDIAIDHSEFEQLSPALIDAVVALMRAEGLTATVSSIHINGWFGSHDKFSGASWMARELFSVELAADIEHWAFVGDSTNDQGMFERFTHSVGVANLARFADSLVHWPRYMASGERGEGFAQVAQAVLQARMPQGAAA